MDYEDKDAVELRKAKYREEYKGIKTLKELVKKMDEVRGIKDRTEDKLKNINAAYDVLRIELVPSKMEEDGVENVRYEGIGLVKLTADMWVHQQNTVGLFKWLRKQKLGDLIKEAVPSSTLKAFIKERYKKGKGLPPQDLVKVEPYTRASITKG